MRAKLTTLCRSVAALLVAVPLGAQVAPREGVFGIVRDEEGRPCPGAAVELVARPWPDSCAIGNADVVRATTDARGRFRAELLPGMAYAAWAAIVREGQTSRATPIVERIVPRMPIVLELPPAPATVLERVELTELEGWPLPLTVELESDSSPRVLIRLERVDDDSFGVGPLPGARFTLRVRNAAGVPLREVPLDGASAGRPSLEVAMGKATPTKLAVRDIETGKGVPGAKILLANGGDALAVGETDADGCAELLVLASNDLRCFGPGLAMAGMQQREHAGGEAGWPELREGFEPQWVAHLGPSVELRGKVLAFGKPADDVALVLSEGALHFSQKNSRNLCWGRRTFALDAAGAFVVPGAMVEFPPDLVLVLGPAAIAKLPESWRSARPLVIAPWSVDPSAKEKVELPDFDLASLVPVRVRVVGSDGAPALSAEIALVAERNRFGRTEIPRGVVDRSGTALLLVPPERSFALVGVVGDEYACGRLDTGRRSGEAPVEVTLTIRGPVTIRGRVVDAKGAPRDGINLWMQPDPNARRGARDRDEPRGPAPAAAAVLAEGLESWSSESLPIGELQRSVRTDANGEFTVRVPSLGIAWQIYANDLQLRVDTSEGDPEPLEIEYSR